MRAIKFRGKRIDNDEWVYGWLYSFIPYGDYHERGYMIKEDGGDDYEVNPETVGQYTGLKDKNGKEIYEGDILKQIFHAEVGHVHDGTDMSFDGHHIGEVVITANQGVCMRKPLCWSMETDETTVTNQYKKAAGYRCEVIGNIYENPELLEVDHE